MMNDAEEIQNNIYSAEFSRFFKENFENYLWLLERKRITCLIISFLVLVFVVFLISLVIYNVHAGNLKLNSGTTCFIVYIIVIIAVTIVSYIVSSYKNEVKNNTLGKLLSFIGDFNIRTHSIDSQYIKNLKLFDNFDYCKFDDRLKGKYGLLDVNIQEIELTKGSGKNSHTIFKGILIIIPNRRKIEGYTVIKRNYKKIFKNAITDSNIDMEFNEYYDVSSSNQLDTKYLLTESFMEKMVRFAKHRIGENISISFEKENVNIAISSYKDWFEVPFLKSATNIENYRAIILEVITILKIIDTLNLEPEIGF